MRRLLVLCILFSTALHAEIKEVENFSQLEKKAGQEAIVFIDLDNCLFEAKSCYGSAAWFYHNISLLLEKGYEKKDAIAEFYPRWLKAQEIASVQKRDPEASKIIRRLQKNGITVLGLTHRQPNCRFLTLRLLKENQVDFSLTSPMKEELILDYPNSPRLFEGVVFVHDFNEKGEIVKRLLKELGLTPKKIIFIDDSMHNLLSVEKELSTTDIEFIGLHFPYRQGEEFDPQIADVQEFVGHRILSDDAIRAIITGQNPGN